MTDGTCAVPEGRRVEALRRLGVLGAPAEPALEELVELLRELLAADRAALALVGEGRAELTVITDRAAPLDLPRAASVADVAVRAAPAPAVRVDAPYPRAVAATHPWCGEVDAPPATFVGAAIPAPDGAPIGALEFAWDGAGSVPERWSELAGRAAVQVGRWLERRAEAEEYRGVVELAPDAIAILDAEGTIELVNPAMAQLLHVDEHDLLGRSFLDLAAPADLARVTGALAPVLVSGARTASFDVDLRRRDGTVLPASVSAGHLRGYWRSIQVVVRDLSDRLRAESERARLTERLAQAHRFETVGQLAGGLAHDLNNLLAVLLSNVELAQETIEALARGEPLDEGLAALREDLGSLQQASSRVDGLTRRLLTFAARPPPTEEVDVAASLRLLAGLLQRSLGDGLDLEVDVPDDVPDVEVDPGRFEQAVTNLVLNARDALPDGGTIRLAVRAAARDEPPVAPSVAPSEEGHGPTVVVTVADRGVGMPPEVRDRAFEPLFTTKAPGQGTGLGLFTVRRFVEEAGGSVHVDTEAGRGTEVSLHLPAARRHPTASGPRVVLLEPGDRSRQVIGHMLAGAGYRVEARAEVTAALAAVAAGRVAVLVAAMSDTDPPVREVVADARARDADLPVIVVEGDTTGLDDVPGVVVLPKPFGSDRLVAAVGAVRREVPDRTA